MSHEDVDDNLTGQTFHNDLQNKKEVNKPTIFSRASVLWYTVCHHFARHVGAGVVASVAYFDPGNWSVDLQAGSQYGYKLLFVIVLAGVAAVVLQAFATKLGCITGLDLASHCRARLNNHPKHPRLVRRLCLYPLYVLCEIAIISTDLAELLGSAIALSMLFPKLPLWAGVLLTSLDVLVILCFSNTGKGRPARLFEGVIILLVFAVFTSFVILIVKVNPHWKEVFTGFLPSKTLVNPGALYISIGIIGATVMPHALFLGSSLATLDRVSREGPPPPRTSATKVPTLKSIIIRIRSSFYLHRTEPLGESRGGTQHHGNNSLAFIQSHLWHGMVDVVMSLLGIAIPINSSILILAGAVFFVNNGSNANAGLFDVHELLGSTLGKPAAFIFALALLCAGQSAAITATLAGQIVSEGFLEWKVSPLLRRLFTRIIGLIPSAIVAATAGRRGIDVLLVASQVVLAIILPFVVFPLVYLTSSSTIMRVTLISSDTSEDLRGQEKEVNYHNNKFMAALGYLIFCVIVVANAYLLVTLMMGKQNA